MNNNCSENLFQTPTVAPMTVAEINIKTARARSLPPSGDQTHVLVEDGEDPWVISHNNKFYYCTVDRTKQVILIAEFNELHEMGRAPLIPIWQLPATTSPCHEEIWSPELQLIDGKWYIYFARYNGNISQERIFVLEGLSENPLGKYELRGKLEIPTERWAIDGSVLISNGEKYFIWSGWDEHENTSQNIYIAKMKDPFTLSSDRVLISKPELEWEMQGYPYVNEGPQALVNGEKIFIIYSASGSWTDDYCLGQLTYTGGEILDPSCWKKEPNPVFAKTNTIFGPGHASFVKHDGQDFIIYHAARSSGAGWARQIRAKQFSWKPDGFPDFGSPV
ncbi:MAG TPA: glycoside hydrolase family 43 protein [Cytophagaceae bacterium]